MRSAARQVTAHARLAKAVLRGEFRSCPWEALKAIYFGGSTEQGCIDRLADWAVRHAIDVEMTKQRTGAGERIVEVWMVKLRPKAAR